MVTHVNKITSRHLRRRFTCGYTLFGQMPKYHENRSNIFARNKTVQLALLLNGAPATSIDHDTGRLRTPLATMIYI